MNNRTGPRTAHATIFIQVYGEDWRSMRDGLDKAGWRLLHDDFVYEVTRMWKLQKLSARSVSSRSPVEATTRKADSFEWADVALTELCDGEDSCLQRALTTVLICCCAYRRCHDHLRRCKPMLMMCTKLRYRTATMLLLSW